MSTSEINIWSTMLKTTSLYETSTNYIAPQIVVINVNNLSLNITIDHLTTCKRGQITCLQIIKSFNRPTIIIQPISIKGQPKLLAHDKQLEPTHDLYSINYPWPVTILSIMHRSTHSPFCHNQFKHTRIKLIPHMHYATPNSIH